MGGLALSVFAADAEKQTSSFKKNWMNTWRVLNFLILAFFLVKLLREPLTRFLQQGAEAIRQQLQGNEEACLEAERELEGVERRLESLNEEIQHLQVTIGERGEIERDKIIENAKQTAEQVLEKARLEAAQRVQQAQGQLRREVIDLAVERAEETVRKAINNEDRERLVNEYLKELKEVPSPDIS